MAVTSGRRGAEALNVGLDSGTSKLEERRAEERNAVVADGNG